MAYYIIESLKHFIDKEEISGPLLISEPFKISTGKIDSHLEDLKDLGFELDRLNSEVIALRTLPKFVPQNILREVTLILIGYFEQNKIKEFSPELLKIFIETHWNLTPPMAFHTLTNIVSLHLESLQETNSPFVLLEDQNLKRLL